ncbi:fimbrial protein [Orbus wheelerorum]|uniref:fimbrial protein n=1 Tax=Orbus wheelerorum TaxID=3074111 RepID=UPI00370DD9E5
MKLGLGFFLILNLFFITQSHAACTRIGNPGVTLYLDMGTVVVSPNLNVGDMIVQQSFPFSQTQTLFYCNAGDSLEAAINIGFVTNNSNKIYQTNIPGIGIQLLRNSDDNLYPYIYKPKNSNNIYLAAGNFIVRLFKTSEIVGSGPLTSGNYTTYGPLGGGITASGLTTYMSANGTTIVAPSCTVVSGAQQNVYLDPVSYTKLKTVGATVGDTNFTIQLKCSGGASLNVGYDNISMAFSGTIPSNLSNADGVLVNNVSSNGAQGIGIQVLDSNKKAIEFDNKYIVGSLATPQDSYFLTSNYTARYYRYGTTITPGTVEAQMVFNMTYD